VELILKACGVEKFFPRYLPETGLKFKTGGINMMLPVILFDI
jgi:hypothetical protein